MSRIVPQKELYPLFESRTQKMDRQKGGGTMVLPAMQRPKLDQWQGIATRPERLSVVGPDD
jgi:hypothetical protein